MPENLKFASSNAFRWMIKVGTWEPAAPEGTPFVTLVAVKGGGVFVSLGSHGTLQFGSFQLTGCFQTL